MGGVTAVVGRLVPALLSVFFLGVLLVVVWFSWLFVRPLLPRRRGGAATGGAARSRRRWSAFYLSWAVAGVAALGATVWVVTHPGPAPTAWVGGMVAVAGLAAGLSLLCGSVVKLLSLR